MVTAHCSEMRLSSIAWYIYLREYIPILVDAYCRRAAFFGNGADGFCLGGGQPYEKASLHQRSRIHCDSDRSFLKIVVIVYFGQHWRSDVLLAVEYRDDIRMIVSEVYGVPPRMTSTHGNLTPYLPPIILRYAYSASLL